MGIKYTESEQRMFPISKAVIDFGLSRVMHFHKNSHKNLQLQRVHCEMNLIHNICSLLFNDDRIGKRVQNSRSVVTNLITSDWPSCS